MTKILHKRCLARCKVSAAGDAGHPRPAVFDGLSLKADSSQLEVQDGLCSEVGPLGNTANALAVKDLVTNPLGLSSVDLKSGDQTRTHVQQTDTKDDERCGVVDMLY